MQEPHSQIKLDEVSSKKIRIFAAIVWGGLMGTLIFAVGPISSTSANPITGAIQMVLMLLILPGLIGSMAIGGNVHAFSFTSGVVVNSLFHFGMCWLLFPLLARLRKSLKLFAVGVVIVSGMQTVYAQISETERFQNAKRLYDAGRLAEAEKGFAEITHGNPENIPAQMYLGQTLFREEKYASAVVPYEKVRSLEKRGTKLTLTQHRILNDQLAMAYGVSGRSAEAKALLQESVRTDPGYPLNYYNLACVSSDEDDKVGVLRNLSLAFQHKDQVLPGEQMPDPVSDPSFKKYAQDPEFKALVARLGR